MKRILLFAISLCCSLALLSTQAQERENQKSQPVETQSSQQHPGPGQLLITSQPNGLKVYLEKHKEPPGNNLLRFGVVEEKMVGNTPLLLDLAPGDYTIAVERSFNSGAAEVAKVPRGCLSSFSFSGSTVFWDCFKCNFYPLTDKKFHDEIDPYQRDGNIGMCFFASNKADLAIRYYRLYAVRKTDEAARLEAKFEEEGKSKK